MLPVMLASWLALASSGFGAVPSASDGDRPLEELSLEELLRVEVTTVVGVAQEHFSTPAALYVITAEDIRRAGHRTLEEALRLVPGMFVAKANSSTTVAGPRGLVGSILTSNRMLVLVDGRVVYDPLINVTLWDVVDVVIEDVARIEVIRGPGPTLWGVNAMNGVVNVITRSAHESDGLLAVAGAGRPTESFAVLRYGQRRERASYRLWAKLSEDEALETPEGVSLADELTRVAGGFRIDGGDVDGVGWTLQGGAFRHPVHRISVRQPIPERHLEFEQVIVDDEVDGAFLRFGLERGVGEKRGFRFHTYYDERDRQTSRVGFRRRSFDIDFRAWRDLGDRHSLVWGAQAHENEDEIDDGTVFRFDPDERSWSTVNVFGQLTRTLIPERLYGLVGTKLTYHDFVGLELQPSARLWWTPSERQMWWGAISRPVRVPSRLEEDGFIILAWEDPGIASGGPPVGAVPIGVSGNDGLRAETMIAYELGHRVFGADWQLETALFYNDYTRLIGVPEGIFGTFIDQGEARVGGIEVRGAVQPAESWQLTGSASWRELEVDGPIFDFEDGSMPQVMAQLRSTWTAAPRLQLHGALYFVDRLPQPDIDAYLRLDLGITWRLRDDVELALWGQNLIEPHVESGVAEIPRGGYLMLRLDL